MPPSGHCSSQSPETINRKINKSAFNNNNNNHIKFTKDMDVPEQTAANKALREKMAALHKTGLISAIITVGMYYYGTTVVGTNMMVDPRQNTWIMMQSSSAILVLSLVFIFGVTVWGPWVMRNRQPVKGLKNVMIMYNVLQVVYNCYVFYLMCVGGWINGYSLTCQQCDYSNNPQAITMLHGAYWYYISKFIDLLDTVFFVMNKKYEHVSLLHVIHHSVMPVNTFFVIRYMPGGHSTFIGLLNSFVHIVMYFYYCVAAMGPRFRKFLWWKRYLTKLQLSQFIAVILHSSQLAFIDCPIDASMTRFLLATTYMFLFLFSDFYIKAYLSKKQKMEEREQEKLKSLAKSKRNSTTSGVVEAVQRTANNIFNLPTAPCFLQNNT
ncbi:unnamed protein product, partial [Meganyctiphanes norvegica]